MDVTIYKTENPGFWEATDHDTEVSCTFKEFDFENTAKYDFKGDIARLGDCPELKLAKATRELYDDLKEEIPWMMADIHTYGKEIRKDIGRRIKEAREKYGMTVKQCADLCFLSPQNYHRVEMGNYNYTVDTLIRIASAMEIDILL